MSEQTVKRFVGVGIDHYADHDDLEYPVAEVRAVATTLAQDFDGQPLCDPGETGVREMLKALARERCDVMVMLWSGHGTVRPNRRLALPTADQGGLITAADVVDFCAESGASQLLCIIDACYAGTGVLAAAEITSAWFEEFPPESDRVWFGVLVSASSGEQARDGRFGAVLRRLLTEGPRSADLRRRWSPYNRMILGEDLGHALLEDEDWDDHGQSPKFLRMGRSWYMFPNPLWEPEAPAQVVEHLLAAARGGAGEGEVSWFTGRSGEVNAVVAWVLSGTAGLRVVTGSAGTGKSAIVGRVVSVSNPVERARLGDPESWSHDDPGENAIQAHMYARGLTADQLATVLNDQLVGAGVLSGDQEQRRHAGQLVNALQQHAQRPEWVPPVVVVDGLDEARGEAFEIARELLCRMAAFATVIVATRDLPGADSGPGLVETLAPVATLDLDAPDGRRSQTEAMDRYIHRRLDDVCDALDPTAVAAQVIAAEETSPFLLARIVTDQLRTHPIDTSAPGWKEELALSLGSALDIDLARITSPGRALVDGDDPVALARGLLTALTWGLGAGFPEPEWVTVASATTGIEIGREHISWVLDELGRYVVQDGEAGVAVYRLAHQSLADHLRPPFLRSKSTVFDPAAGPVAAALLRRYRVLLTDGHPVDAPKYLWLYAYRHAATAGPSQLDAFRELTVLAPALLADLAAADTSCARDLGGAGHHEATIALSLEAAALYRDLAANNPAYREDLADALGNLSIAYDKAGRRQEAIALATEVMAISRDLADEDPGHVPGLAAALGHLGSVYGAMGRDAEGLPYAEEGVALLRELAADNPNYRDDLAGALNDLGLRYSALGRRERTLTLHEETVALRRDLMLDNPVHLLDLANSLNNLGVAYAKLDHEDDAIACTEEAIAILRGRDAADPTEIEGLASALNNLGVRYSAVGRSADAVTPAQEAVALYRAAAVDKPDLLPSLANALSNLGNRYGAIGHWDEAVAVCEEAVGLYRDAAAHDPGIAPDLARALTNLGNRYHEMGRLGEASASAEEAVRLRRAAAADNPVFVPDLASALNNLATVYGSAGRNEIALATAEEAVALSRELASADPAVHRPLLASALNNLGIRYGRVDRNDEAVALTEQALALFKELASTNRAYLTDVASTQNNLGVRYADTGRRAEAIALTEEIVTLRRQQVVANPAHTSDLADALLNLGAYYSDEGRSDTALPLWEEAVGLYRSAAAGNSGKLPDLASALYNLGNLYRELDRAAEARTAIEEAFTIGWGLAAEDPTFLPDLAEALPGYVQWLVEDNPGIDSDVVWRQAIDTQTAYGRSFLWLERARSAPEDDLRAVAWLAQAASTGTADRGLLFDVHECARRRHGRDPAGWQRTWITVVGETPPPWLDLDPELLAMARAWLATPTYEDEMSYLLDHLALLETDLDAAVDEALLLASDPDRYLRIRQDARRHGVQAAYQSILRDQAVSEFLTADPTRQRLLLEERAQDLLNEDTRQHVAGLIDADPDDPQPRRAAALIALADRGLDTPTVRAGLDALEDPARFAELLETIATTAGDVSGLSAVAELARLAAPTAVDAADALVYEACGTAIDPGSADVEEILRQAISLTPKRRPRWIARLAGIAAVHPEVLTLIRYIAEDLIDAED